MRIGIDIRSLFHMPWTGVGEYTFAFTDALLRHHPEHAYALLGNNARDMSAVVPDEWRRRAEVCITRMPNKLFTASSVLFGAPVLGRRKERLDVIFSPNLNMTTVPKRSRFALTIHDLSFAFFPDCFSLKQRLWHRAVRPGNQCRRAEAILVPSEHTKRDLVSAYRLPASRVHVIPPGLPSVFLDGSAASTPDVVHRYELPETYVLFVGAIERRKNVDGLIEAFQLWKKTSHAARRCQLVLAGPLGYGGRAVIEAIRAASDIRYLGYVPREARPALYARASLFAYPSFYEGFGLPVLEAFAMGVPVVTSNLSSLPEVSGGAAYLVNPYNVSAIADGLERMMADEALRQRSVAAGKERARTFDWAASVARALEVFESIV